MTGPLEGVLVADFSRVLAGPLCTMNLADLGATVVKVERPGAGDDTRAWGPPWSSRGSTYFESVNRSKRSAALDLKDPADHALALELASRADVLVENYRPGALTRHGLGYEQVRALNPSVIYCSITGFGSDAGADLMGYDFVVQAIGGLMSVTGDPDGEPTKAGVALVDVLTGKDATIGVLAALAARGQSGQGCRVQVNLLSSLLSALVNQAQGYLETGEAPRRMGNRHPSIAPYETLRCRDGLLAVACGNDGQFVRFASVVGAPELSSDSRFVTNTSRVAHRGELVEALESCLATKDAGTWAELLTDAQVPAGKVGTIADGVALAERLGLSPTVEVGAGHARQVRQAVTFDPDLVARPTAPPGLGADTAAIRAWLAAPHGNALSTNHPTEQVHS
ncbi:MAG TPA: CoA transferase [Dermatophilaceae bacterium]|jgi:crotonobetainyl-CoA:carnitine CoA-transferase CaiB-like acyl-CoA transferase